MSDCCKKPKFKLEKSEKLTHYEDTRVYIKGMKNPIKGSILNREFQNYMIFCTNCGNLDRKGEM